MLAAPRPGAPIFCVVFAGAPISYVAESVAAIVRDHCGLSLEAELGFAAAADVEVVGSFQHVSEQAPGGGGEGLEL